MISQAGLRAAALTKKLLTFSRRQVFEPKELPVNQAIRELEGLDKSEISSTFNRVGIYADEWDDKLKSKYFRAEGGTA